MKKIFIICEGETEQEFCNKTLSPYLFRSDIQIQTPLIKKSHGGIVPWKYIKKQVEELLSNGDSPCVTLFIDYYGIKDMHQFPKWEEAKSIADKHKKLDKIEENMQNDISEGMRNRFIPYIQLHEFEALLLSDKRAFDTCFTTDEIQDREELNGIFKTFDNPEDINNNVTTVPSARLSRIISGYDKIVYGNLIAEEIGLETIMSKNPRFTAWIKKIKSISE